MCYIHDYHYTPFFPSSSRFTTTLQKVTKIFDFFSMSGLITCHLFSYFPFFAFFLFFFPTPSFLSVLHSQTCSVFNFVLFALCNFSITYLLALWCFNARVACCLHSTPFDAL